MALMTISTLPSGPNVLVSITGFLVRAESVDPLHRRSILISSGSSSSGIYQFSVLTGLKTNGVTFMSYLVRTILEF